MTRRTAARPCSSSTPSTRAVRSLTGQFGLTLEGTTFGVASTSVDWLVLHDNEARLGGAATVNGVAGYSYQVIATDGGKNDTIRVVVRDSSMTVVYDSGEARVTGQVSIH